MRIRSGESETLSRSETKQLADLGAIDAVPWALHRRYISTAALDECSQRFEAWILAAGLDGGDCWLRNLAAAGKSPLG